MNADVSVTGDVDPTPNSAGGQISGILAIGQGIGGSGGNAGITTVGTMRIDSGTRLTVGDGVVGNRLGSNGIVEVSGFESQWLIDDDVAIGNEGYGELNISNQGWVGNNDAFLIGSDSDGRGWVTLNDPLSMLNVGRTLTVGSLGIGNLSTTERARVVSEDGIVGGGTGSVGLVAVSGESSWRNRANLIIGDSGTGTLVVDSGGLVENTNGILSDEASGLGEARVEGLGSLWLNRNNLIVGDNNSASVHVADHGTLQANGDLNIRRRGVVAVSNGNVIAGDVSNAGVISGSGRITGDVSVTSTGSIRSNQSEPLVFVSAVSNAGNMDSIEGHLQFQRAVTNAETGLIAGRDGVFRFDSGLTNSGRLGFSAGSTDVFGAVNTTATGSIHVGGEGVVTFYDDVTNAGTLRVEPESFAVFLGDLSTTAATQVAGLRADPQPAGEPSLNDSITVHGSLQLGGLLSILPSTDLDAITEPASRGDQVTLSVANASELVGQFSTVEYASATLDPTFPLADGRSFRSHDQLADENGIFRTVQYTESELEIINYWALEGDTDGDLDVDFADFLTMSGNFGNPGTWTDGDFDGDGQVAFGDFLSLSTNFGASVAAAQPVPEPSTALLFACGLWGWASSFRRTRPSR